MHVQGFVFVVVEQLEEGSIVGKDEEELIFFLQRPWNFERGRLTWEQEKMKLVL